MSFLLFYNSTIHRQALSLPHLGHVQLHLGCGQQRVKELLAAAAKQPAAAQRAAVHVKQDAPAARGLQKAEDSGKCDVVLDSLNHH